jgi:hypothetical protein
MATMGLRINDGGRGGVDTSVADVFAKAIWGDKDTEMKFARLQSDLATDEYQRAQIAAHTAYNQALTDAAQWKLDSQKGAVDPAGKLVYDQQHFPNAQPAAAPAMPVPVELAAPTPDQVLRPQPPAPEMPVPVEPQVAELAAPDTVFRPQPPPAPGQVSYEEPVPVEPVGPAVPPIDAMTAPDQVLRPQPPPAGPVDPNIEPSFALGALAPVEEIIPEVSDPHAALTIPGQPFMGPNMPVPIQPEIADPHAALTTPGEIADPHAALTASPEVSDPHMNMPVPVMPEIADPHAALTIPGAQPEISDPHLDVTPVTTVDTPDGPLPLTRQEANALAQEIIANGGDVAGGLRTLSGTVGLTYGNMKNPDRMRIAAQLATGNLATTSTVVTEGDFAGVDAAARQAAATEAAKPVDPKKDVYSDQYGDRQIIVNPDGTKSIRWISGGVRNDVDLKKNKITGKDGIIYDINPADGSLTVAEGQTGADANGHLTGAGENIQHFNRLVDLNRKLNQNIALTDDEKMLYAQSYNALYGDKTTTSQDASGKDQATTIVVKPPAGTRKPDQLVPGAVAPAVAAPAVPADAAAAAAPAVAAPTVAAPTQAEEIAANRPVVTGAHTIKNVKGEDVPVKNNGGWTTPGEKTPVTTEKVPVPGAEVTTTTFGEPKNRQVTGEAEKAYKHTLEAIPAMAALDRYGPHDKPLPSSISSALDEWATTGINMAMVNNIVDPETRAYARNVLTFINAPKRTESGAAVSASEVAEYKKRFAMPAGSTSATDYFSTRANRVQYLRAARMALTSEATPQMLRQLDEELARYGVDLDWLPPQDGDTGQKKQPKEFTVDDNGQRVPVGGS